MPINPFSRKRRTVRLNRVEYATGTPQWIFEKHSRAGGGTFFLNDIKLKEFLVESTKSGENEAGLITRKYLGNARMQSTFRTHLAFFIREGLVGNKHTLARVGMLPEYLSQRNPSMKSTLIRRPFQLLVGFCSKKVISNASEFEIGLSILENAAKTGGASTLNLLDDAVKKSTVSSNNELVNFYSLLQKLFVFSGRLTKTWKKRLVWKYGAEEAAYDAMKHGGGFYWLALEAPHRLIDTGAIKSVPEFRAYVQKVISNKWDALSLADMRSDVLHGFIRNHEGLMKWLELGNE